MAISCTYDLLGYRFLFALSYVVSTQLDASELSLCYSLVLCSISAIHIAQS